MASKPQAATPRAEFRHPVLQMMGISRLRVPGRNWLIFWGITGTLVGGYYWDRRERKKVRDYWIDRVSYMGDQPLDPLDMPRKVKVYVAPPPNDFIDASLQHFRNFIKPVLTAAAVDHELVIAERQGYIRSTIAEDVRNMRRAASGAPTLGPTGDDLDQRVESKVQRDLTGGVIIVGRGAYKEYMTGLQEGWFGPLEQPQFVTEQIEREKEEEKERLRRRHEEKAKATDGESQMDYDNQEAYEEDRKATLDRKYPVIPPYILTKDLSDISLPADFAEFKQEPISVFRLPHLLGILMTPVRIYRWLNQRHLAEEMGRQAVGVVLAQTRPYDAAEDSRLAMSDEDDWPTKFKQTGMDKDSEWMREFFVDPRFTEQMRVYKEASRDHSSDTSVEGTAS